MASPAAVIVRTLLIVAVAVVTASDVRAQSRERPAEIVDSIVLERHVGRGGLQCTYCPPPRLVLHRASVVRGALEHIANEADRIGFYAMPSELRAKVGFCQVLISDALDATIAIYHRNQSHSVTGYQHCVGGRDGMTFREPQLLRQLEAHIHRRHENPMATRDVSFASDSCPLFPNVPVFESQVDRRASFLRTSNSGPYPDATLGQSKPYTADFALAQFTVDTAGRPVIETLGMLASPLGLPIERVRQASMGWHFEPAMRRGCKVAQLVYTPLRWK